MDENTAAPRVLVTGAGGLIGARTVRALVGAGARVHAHLGLPEHALSQPPQDIETSYGQVDAIVIGAVDAVVHLAGPPSVAQSFARPELHARVHVVGTTHIAKQCADAGVHLVYVSSAEVYGRPLSNPVAETATPAPVSPYGAAKMAAETMVRLLCPSAGVLRPFSVYASDSPATSLLGRVRAQADAAEIVLATLAPVRDYVHVDDVAAAIVTATLARVTGTWNVGSGVGTSVAALAELVAPGRPLRETGADRPVDVLELIADPTEAERALGWRARIPLQDGLTRG